MNHSWHKLWACLGTLTMLVGCGPLRRPMPLPTETPRASPAATAIQAPARASPTGTAGQHTPKDAVRAFFEDYVAALNDPQLADPQRQRVLAERIAAHVEPEGRPAIIESVQSAFKEVGSSIELLALLEEQMEVNLDFALTEFDAEVLSAGDTAGLVRINRGVIAMTVSGEGAALLSESGTLPNSQMDLSSMLGDDSRDIPVKLIDGIWYIAATATK